MDSSLLDIALQPFVKKIQSFTGVTLRDEDGARDFNKVYQLYTKSFGEPQAVELITNIFEEFKRTHDQQTTGDFLKVLPGNLFQQERLVYLSHEELEKIVKEKTAEALKLKDEFFYIATHDLKTPVTAISGFVSLLLEHKGELSPDLQEDVQSIKEGSDRLKQLVNDLLQVARSESGTIKVDLTPLDLKIVMDRTITQVSLPATAKKVTIDADVPSTLVLADEKKLSEVLENLLSNAVKYNKEGGSVVVSSTKNDGYLTVTIKDTGLGIPKVQQTKIFQKFYRAQNDATRDIQGTGLGLFVVKMLVEKMGGSISFTSEENVGTTFVFSLKLA